MKPLAYFSVKFWVDILNGLNQILERHYGWFRGPASETLLLHQILGRDRLVVVDPADSIGEELSNGKDNGLLVVFTVGN